MGETLIGAVIGGLVTLIGGYISGFFKAKTDVAIKKEDSTLSANDQAFMMFKNLVNTIQKELDETNEDLSKLSQINIELREQRVEDKFTIKALQKENLELIEQNKNLKIERAVVSK